MFTCEKTTIAAYSIGFSLSPSRFSSGLVCYLQAMTPISLHRVVYVSKLSWFTGDYVGLLG